MAISIQNHSATIASKVVGVFKEDIPVRAGFSAIFPNETTPTLHVDIEVERDSDLIAVDVMRFTEGNKNKSSKATEKKFQPPFFKEEYDFARDDIYMSTVALGAMDVTAANQAIAQNALKNVRSNRKKIERAIQKMHADVLQTGIVSLKNGDSIDFKRKSGSMVDLLTAGYWSTTSNKPLDDLANGMKFLREVGNSNGSTVNVFMRTAAFNAMMATTQMTSNADFRRVERINIGMPEFSEATGMALQGQVAAGDFVVNLWTYNEKYTDANGLTQYYLSEKNVIMLPNDFQGKTVFGGLPYMRSASVGGQDIKIPGVFEAEYLLRGYDDEKTISSTLELTSAPLVIPFTVDKIYTLKVLA
jgi:hypothetical protein